MKYLVMFGLLFILSCKSDDDSSGLNTLDIAYEQNFIETSFLEAGETAPPLVNWSGEKVTFSATTLPNTAPDDLFNINMSIDEETGVLSWDRSIPLGKTDIFITASNALESTTVLVTINNTFVEGLFYGGFNDDISDEPNTSTTTSDGSLALSKEGTAGLLISSDGDIISIDGTWTIDESLITINFNTNNRVLKGIMNGENDEPAATFIGQWGEGLDQNNNIENLKGAFRFIGEFISE
ncbi:hypothetical protein [Aquimarina algiphila]|uniref:Uncharacterized protein n=1 Tax=Aquimarina algiphila TaxID=2047982 RepID=A0A554VMD7_9FLAO|nr:hypothetical protein [Aquimarina algiphila]TSE09370.1 hypothetical protein FOF46_08940 [Aquimarina algiphila]